MFRSILFTLGVVALVPAAARADQFDSQVRVQMFATAISSAADGWRLNERMQVGALRQGYFTTYTFTTNENVRYRLVANCDADCNDIDISVTEPDGREIAWDRRSGDLAVVDISGHQGTHTIKVSMASCGVGPCRFGLGVFTR
jgi:IS4 transposase